MSTAPRNPHRLAAPVVALQTRGASIVDGWDWERVRENLAGSLAATAPRAATPPRHSGRDLLALVTQLLDAGSCDEIIASTLDGCFALMPVAAAGLDFLNPVSGVPVQVSGKGVTANFLYLYEHVLRGNDVVLRAALETGVPRQTADLFTEAEWLASAAYRQVFHTQHLAHVLYVPLTVGDQVVGTLNLARAEPAGGFSPDEVALLSDLLGVVTRILVRQLGSAPAAAIEATPQAQIAVLERFSAREQSVAHLVALGRHDREIAEELGLSLHTVKQHLKRIYRKAQVRSRVELATLITPIGESLPARRR